MSNFLIFKAAFNNSATPAIGTYTAEGATALFNLNASISPDYYLYNTADGTAVQWFVPTAEATDFEFVADILTRNWTNRVTYFIIADSTGTTRLRMWSQYNNWTLENSDSVAGSGDPEYIGVINPDTFGGFGVFHQFRVRVRKLTESSSSVEIYVDGTLKLTATAGAALVTCAKIGFVGGVNTFGPGIGAGIKNAYVYDLSGGDVIDRGVLSGAFNRFISWMKSKFALKSDIPTVNDATLTIQQNGTNVQTFTANQSTAATANIQCVDLSTAQTIGGDKDFTGTTGTRDVIPATTDTYDLGSSAKEYNNAYIKSLTINGAAAGDILTHNASEFVPRSGGAVLSDTDFCRTSNDSYLLIGGGTAWGNGASMTFYGTDSSRTPGNIFLNAQTTTLHKTMSLVPSGTWTWDGTAVQITSDQRLKQQISEIDNALLDAWEDVELSQFKYNDAVDQKKDKARLHTGYVVQQIDNACKSHGVDISQYGLYCHEEYPEETKEVEVEQADGAKVKETKVIREASEHYSLRYTEVYAVECMYLRRCIARLTARIEQLEKEQEASK